MVGGILMKKTGSRVKSKKCRVKQASAFVLKSKGRPRGKPFPLGHKFGNRFKKGVSGNPGGRPKFAKLSEATRAALALDPNAKVEPRTNAEAVALSAVKEAKRGNVGAFVAIADRCEGKPVSVLDLKNESADPITELLGEIKAVRVKLYGNKPPSD